MCKYSILTKSTIKLIKTELLKSNSTMKPTLLLVASVLWSVGMNAQVFNTNYVFPSSSIPDYQDRTTLKATELVNDEEIITVGFALEPTSNSKNDLILTKTKAANGAVIWANRYGLSGFDEKGFGLTLSYDKKHVIVAGTAEDPDNPGDWNALAMKVEISTGNVIWATQHGEKDSYQEFRMVEQTFTGPFFPSLPTYFFVGRTSIANQVRSVIYASGIFDFNGTEQWANLYIDAELHPNVNDLAFQMVRDNENKNYMIAGTRYVSNQPSDLFTFGINPANGAISDKYIWYDVDEKNQYEGAICNQIISNFKGFGLAGTTRNPGVALGVDEAITVLWLNNDRSVLNAHYYWQEGHNSNKGLSIYQNTEELKTFDVYTSTTRNITSPGFLNVDVNGPINYFLNYDMDVNIDDFNPTAMVRTKYGYTAKALHANPQNGYKLAGLAPNGRTECAYEEKMDIKEQKFKFDSREYKDDQFGDDAKRKMEIIDIHGKWIFCDGSDGGPFKRSIGESIETATAGTFSAYPNPLNSDQSEFTIAYDLEESSQVSIEVYNALGQRVFSNVETLNAGGDQISISSDLFSSGVNLVVLRSGSDIVYQQKVIKE